MIEVKFNAPTVAELMAAVRSFVNAKQEDAETTGVVTATKVDVADLTAAAPKAEAEAEAEAEADAETPRRRRRTKAEMEAARAEEKAAKAAAEKLVEEATQAPAAPAAAPAPAPAPAPAAAPAAAPADGLTYQDDVRPVMVELANVPNGGRAKAIEILSEYGVKIGQDLPAKAFADVIAKAKAGIAALKEGDTDEDFAV